MACWRPSSIDYWRLATGIGSLLHQKASTSRRLVRLGALLIVTVMQLHEGRGLFMHTSRQLFIPLQSYSILEKSVFLCAIQSVSLGLFNDSVLSAH